MKTDPETSTAAHFAALRSALCELSPPPSLEARLVGAFRAQRSRSHPPIARWLAPAGALAASVVMAVWLLFLPAQSVNDTARAEWAAPQTFVPLVPLPRIALEPKPMLVETELSGFALAELGMAVPPESVHRPMRAEMLLGASGHPLALRISTRRSPR